MSLLALATLLSCSLAVPAATLENGREPIAVDPGPVWPDAGATLDLLAPRWEGPSRRMFLDAGHGNTGNPGNTGVRCQIEAEEMRRIADEVERRLKRPTGLKVERSRPTASPVGYDARIARAEAFGADALVSLHSDARAGTSWGRHPVTGCNHSPGASGFAVLWSDEGSASIVEDRHQLARAIAARMIEAGFPPYPGHDYGSIYTLDPEQPGVFLDRHSPSKRIKMLRRPRVPSVIVETHHALDPAEVDRWNEPRTLDAFAAALRAAMLDLSNASGPPTARSRPR